MRLQTPTAEAAGELAMLPGDGRLHASFQEFSRQARALHTAALNGSRVARARVLRLAPPGERRLEAIVDIDIASAQRVVARESGFFDWRRLRQETDVSAVPAAQGADALVEAALAGDGERAQAILARWPHLPQRSLPASLVLADERNVADGIDKRAVNAAIGPRHWPPLLYLCSSTHPADKATEASRVRIAERLLALGADANAGTPEAETVRGYRTPLGAAIGLARSAALAERLLRAGADIADGPTLYEGSAMWHAVRLRDEASLNTLLAAKPPQWHVCHALPHALPYDDATLTRRLLDAGGDPNWTMGRWGFDGNCLHEAVALGCGSAVAGALIEAGAHVDFKDRDGRTPLALATCLRREELAALLRLHGADDKAVRAVDRWVGACFEAAPRANAGDTDALPSFDSSELTTADHLWLCRALRAGLYNTLPALLAGGLDPNAQDDDGERPLHLAARFGSEFAARTLLAAGADPLIRNFDGKTPLDCLLDSQAGDAAQREALCELLLQTQPQTGAALPAADYAALFEAAADAVVGGDIERLQRALDEHPWLVAARSPRPHRCTLLNYLGANGFETERQRTPANAVAIIELLIERGSDPDAVCLTYRGGPEQTTLGLLTSSGHPRQAGLTMSMVRALGRGGAHLDPVYALLARLHDAGATPVAVDAGSDVARRAIVESAMLGEASLLFALLDAGVAIDAERDDGATALHQAAFNGDEELVDRLLARGADAAVRDKVFNGTAAGWASAGGHDALGRRLEAGGRGA